MGWRDWLKARRGKDCETVGTSRQQLVFGLDFGTAFTKASIGESRVSYAVPFDSLARDSNSYLLPTALSVDRHGYCSLDYTRGRRISDLKMRILERECEPEDEAAIVAFLAMVFRHGRDWLLAKHRNVYHNVTLDWVVNVGLPTDSFHDDELSNLYWRLTASGWDLSFEKNPITLEHAVGAIEKTCSSMLDGTSVSANIDASAISIYPEFVAQVSGYVRSSRCAPGLHCLVDVGAGTLDVTMFNVWRNQSSDDRYPIFGRAVKPLGTCYLAKYRVQEARASVSLSPFDDLPSDLEFADFLSIDIDRLRQTDKSFDMCIRKCIVNVLVETRKSYVSNRGAWSSVPLFLCGGGGRAEFYSRLILDMCQKSQDSIYVSDDYQSPNALRHL